MIIDLVLSMDIDTYKTFPNLTVIGDLKAVQGQFDTLVEQGRFKNSELIKNAFLFFWESGYYIIMSRGDYPDISAVTTVAMKCFQPVFDVMDLGRAHCAYYDQEFVMDETLTASAILSSFALVLENGGEELKRQYIDNIRYIFGSDISDRVEAIAYAARDKSKPKPSVWYLAFGVQDILRDIGIVSNQELMREESLSEKMEAFESFQSLKQEVKHFDQCYPGITPDCTDLEYKFWNVIQGARNFLECLPEQLPGYRYGYRDAQVFQVPEPANM